MLIQSQIRPICWHSCWSSLRGGDYENLERMLSLDYAQAGMSVSLKTVGSKKSVDILNSFQPELERIIQPLKSKYPDFKATVIGEVGS